ncbi:hypothetical protein BT93_A0480 [Corymbia citriodora subsp. variegata]|nr:hypothetical protein BT93_A0480 [Corymbia citriodora subsp. variegata]
MGNCLVLEEKVIKVVKTDGKILEYKSPLRARQVLSEFAAGHVISQMFPATAVLDPDARLLRGHVYYIFPLNPSTTPKFVKTKNARKVRFADEDHKAVEESEEMIKGGESSSSVVRIKVVISKRELAELIARGGFSVKDEMISSQLIQREERSTSLGADDEDDKLSRSWKPALESIREVN